MPRPPQRRLNRDEINRSVLSLNEFELAHMFANFPREALLDIFSALTVQEAKSVVARVPPELTAPFFGSLDPAVLESILGPPNPELQADLREAIGDRDFTSIEEANEALAAHFARKNARPRKDFCGLSPDEMRYVLERPFEAAHIAEFVNPLHVDPDSPATMLFGMLAEAIGGKGLKPTAKGNLPLAFCREAQAALLDRFPDPRWRNDRPLRSEEDLPELHMLHLAARVGGFVRKYRGRIILGRETRRMLDRSGHREVYPALMKAFATRFNWGYMDGYPEFPFVQRSFLFTLFLLRKFGRDWKPDLFYQDHFIRAFPSTLTEVDSWFDRDPADTVGRMLTWRVFEHFCRFFGLVEMKYVKGPNFTGHFRIRSRPLFRDAIRWKVG